METKNICKFVETFSAKSLNVKHFILETNQETLKESIVILSHRLYLISSGEAKMVCNGEKTPVTKGDLFFVFNRESVCVQDMVDFETMYIDFDGTRSSELFNRFGIDKFARKFSGFIKLVPFWQENLINANKNNIELLIESVLLYSLAQFKNEQSEKQKLSNIMQKFTQKNFFNSSLNMATLAKELNYNSKYLSHVFKKEVKMPYAEYLQNLRLNYAISLLNNGIDSIKNVALLSGFGDPYYFSKVFKAKLKMSPTEYLQQKQKKE